MLRRARAKAAQRRERREEAASAATYNGYYDEWSLDHSLDFLLICGVNTLFPLHKSKVNVFQRQAIL